MTILSVFYIFALALVLASLEIQIEGKRGWASKLPGNRKHVPGRLGRLLSVVLMGKAPTLYHFYLFSFVILIFHFPFFYGAEITLKNWVTQVSLMLIFMVLWDLLWFVLNPSFTLKKFSPEHIWWHKKWTAGMPNDYIWGIGMSFFVLLLVVGEYPSILTDWFGVMMGLGFLTSFIHITVHVLPQWWRDWL